MKQYLEGLAISLLALFAPIKAMLLTITILILSDLITGLLASRKQKIPITSAGIRRTLSKFIIYFCAVGLGFITEIFLIDGYIALSKIAAGLIGVFEIKSVLENLDIINGSSIFKSLIQKLGSVNDIPNVEQEAVKKEDPKED